jgi:hypothetical protein
LSQLRQIVRFAKRLVMPGQKSFERLFGCLLAMEETVFEERGQWPVRRERRPAGPTRLSAAKPGCRLRGRDHAA